MKSLIGHIELSRAADLVVVAPATANLLARMAGGLADDLATTLLLATDKRTLVAPAMNVRMWEHAATQRNVERLKADGVLFVGPEAGPMACGEFGPGRLAEPPAIIEAIERALAAGALLDDWRPRSRGPLSGRHVIVTSGPTYEPIDPVRFLGNRSSGRQGHAIAQAALSADARVTLVSGPVSLPDPIGATVIHVETAVEMRAAVEAALPADAFIGAAAVADWRVETVAGAKIKKGDRGSPTVRLVENPDILAEICNNKASRPAVVIGFAAETEDVAANASAKLHRKGCDLIVANSVAKGTSTFGGADESGPAHRRERGGVVAVNEQGGRCGSNHTPSGRRTVEASMITIVYRQMPHAEGLQLPSYGSEDASGMDLVAALPVDAGVVLGPGERALIPTGLAIELPRGFEAQIRPRSGLALHDGVTVLNSPGTVDADYRGEIGVILINFGKKPFEVRRGARIAQLVVCSVERVALIAGARLTSTARGSSGFGSTGRSSEEV